MPIIAGIYNGSGAPIRHNQKEYLEQYLDSSLPGSSPSLQAGSIILISTDRDRSPNGNIDNYHSITGLYGVSIGLITNQIELKRRLGIPDHSEVTNLQLILSAYQRWGTRCLDYMRGPFSFAVFDQKRNRLFCARDQLGTSPLYYSHYDGQLIFSTLPSVISSCHHRRPTLNNRRIAEYITGVMEGCDHVSTFYNEVLRLPPAHFLTIDRDGIKIERYWKPQYIEIKECSSERNHIERFNHLLDESIRNTSITNEIGIMLSGGIDSATVYKAALRSFPGRHISTLSCIDNDLELPDSKCIIETTRDHNCNTILITPPQLSEHLPELDRLYDNCEEPFDFFMLIPQLSYIMAKKHSIHKVFDGVDGDITLYDGGHVIRRLIQDGSIASAWNESTGETNNVTKLIYFLRLIISSYLPQHLHNWKNKPRLTRHAQDIITNSLLKTDLVNEFKIRERIYGESLRSSQLSFQPLNIAHTQLIQEPFIASGFERYYRVATTYGIEPLHPLLDLNLIEFCISLPWYLRRRHGIRKYLLRHAIKDELPPSVAWRTDKSNLVPVFSHALFRTKRTNILDFLASPGVIGDYVDIDRLRSIQLRYDMQGRLDDGMAVWNAYALAKWLIKASRRKV